MHDTEEPAHRDSDPRPVRVGLVFFFAVGERERDRAMQVRARAARELIAAGELDPYIGLSYVISPPPELDAAMCGIEWSAYTAEQHTRVLELVDQGYSQAKAGVACGVPHSTVKWWVQRRRVAA